MLLIEIPSKGDSKLSFSKLQRLDMPAPANGFRQEINDTAILSFNDEQDAVDYANELEKYAGTLSDHHSLEYLAARDIINAINNDQFVQAYRQE